MVTVGNIRADANSSVTPAAADYYALNFGVAFIDKGHLELQQRKTTKVEDGLAIYRRLPAIRIW